MLLIDRYILGRFLSNFAILFVLLFLFASALDVILALDEYVETVQENTEIEGAFRRAVALIGLAVNFQSPRLFQFYGFLHGIVAVGAMGFTLGTMHRYRELVAILGAGIGMHRVAMPFIIGVFILSIVQLMNQELIMPKVAPLLLRDHGELGKESVAKFPIHFTRDGQGSLFHARSFDPRTSRLREVTILERDEQGRTVRRVTARRATWSGDDGVADGRTGWQLENGSALVLVDEAEGGQGQRALDFYESDLSPRMLTVRRYGTFASMLSLGQIERMLETPGVTDANMLRRFQYSRFASVLINILVMWMALPTFLLRQPANLLVQTMLCAAITIPAMLGGALFMMVDLPGISPAVGVFLPVLVLIPVVLGQWTYLKT
jgi:lipopolysaccharide export LptBFGC system permease protein LptF